MAVDLYTRQQIDGPQVAVELAGKTVGFVSVETWREHFGAKERKRVTLRVPEWVPEEADEAGDGG